MPDIKYKRNLPHIHPEGYPLFITFRLADSLPARVLAELKAQRERELNSKPNLSPSERFDIERKFFSRYDEWLDRCEHGPRWLENENVARIVSDKIYALDHNRYNLYAFCIMPNHGHMLIEPLSVDQLEHKGKSAKYPVTDSLRLIKGSSARACNLLLGRTGSFWHHESYDHYVRDEQELERNIKYIFTNPVKAGLVKEWTDWKFTYVSPELGEW
ncbi:MAG TPA: transposase [Anaerolineales bacterium]|nr:transposase [Anaerolineales bacterium]